MPIVIEAEDEFIERHGQSVWCGEYFIHEDGAIRNQYGRDEPPTDKNQLLTLKIRFHQARIAEMKGRYRRLHTTATTQAQWHLQGTGPLPQGDYIKHLKMLDRLIQINEKLLGELEAQLPRNRQREIDRNLQASNREHAESLMKQVYSLPNY